MADVKEKETPQIALRSLMTIGSADDDNLLFDINIPNTFAVLIDDLVSAIMHLMQEALSKVNEEDKEEQKALIHAHVVQAFSLVVDEFHTVITPTVEEEIRELVDHASNKQG